MRVLHLVHDSRRTGVPMLAANMVRAMTRVGQPCTVFFASQGDLAEELAGEGTEVLTAGRRIPLLWRFYRFLMAIPLFRLCRHFDLLHIHSLKMAHLVPFARLFGCRTIFHVHELPQRFGPMTRLAFSMADCVAFCSETCSRHFATLPARRKEVLLNAIPTPTAPRPPQKNSQPVIVEVASINRRKGQDLLLAAFRKMRNKNVRLLFYGPESVPRSYLQGLQQFIVDNELASRVSFMGVTSRPLEVMAEADIVVQPSRNEPFGLTLVEAMCSCRPVVAHDIDGMREIVVDGVTGFLVPCGDTAALAEKLDYLLDHPGEARQMGEAGRQRAQEKFDIDRRVPDYLALYGELCPH